MQCCFPSLTLSKLVGPTLVSFKERYYIFRILTSILAFDHLGTSTTMLKSICKNKRHL